MEDIDEVSILRVSGTSNPSSLGSAIAHAVYDNKPVAVRAIGAGAVNQAVKAITIARGYVAETGYNLTCIPGFTNVQMKDGVLSAIVFRIVVS